MICGVTEGLVELSLLISHEQVYYCEGNYEGQSNKDGDGVPPFLMQAVLKLHGDYLFIPNLDVDKPTGNAGTIWSAYHRLASFNTAPVSDRRIR